METTNTNNNAAQNANEILKSLGFKGQKRVGINALEHNDGETVYITVTGPIAQFTAKKIDPKTKEPATYDFVNVTNLLTGEADLTYWLSGQIRYAFEEMQNYVGKSFAITSLGKKNVDGMMYNQFSIVELQK